MRVPDKSVVKHGFSEIRIRLLMLAGIFINGVLVAQQADNPLFKNICTADPHPYVYDGRFYIVCGQDEPNSTYFNMYGWRLLSSSDMSTWTDHGVIARPSGWMPDNRAWASCIINHNGMFYFYVATNEATGVFTSSSITGPYTDPIGKPLIDIRTPGHADYNIDPCVVFADSTPYIFLGGVNCRYGKLAENMISLDGGLKDVPGLTSYFEAPFVFKSDDLYFLLYADKSKPSKIRYATSEHITGPWIHQGVIGESTGTTNHPGAAFFNGQWWYTYHTEELSNRNMYSRCVCVDPLTVSNGTIEKIIYSSFYETTLAIPRLSHKNDMYYNAHESAPGISIFKTENGDIRMETGASGNSTVEMFDVTGRIFQSTRTVGKCSKSGYSIKKVPGTYLMRVENGKKEITDKLIINGR